jgi:MFS family permease
MPYYPLRIGARRDAEPVGGVWGAAMAGAPRVAAGRTFRSLQNRNYRLYWLGQVVSLSGTWMQRIAQAWLVLQLTHSPLALGTVTTVQFTPILLFSLFGGVLADRVPKWRFLLLTQSVMAVQALALAILVSTGRIELAHIYVLAAILGVASALDGPTRQAFVIELVGRDDLPNAVALNSTLFNVSRILGPGIGGVLIAWVGVAGCFYVNAFSFCGVIGGLLLMDPGRFFAGRPAREGRVLRQIGAGLRHATTTPDAALPLLLMGILGIFGYNFTVLLPLIGDEVLHSGAIGFGVLTAAMGVGSLLAALGVAYRGRATRQTLLIGAAGFSVLLFAVGASRWWALTLPLLVALGVCSITFSATASTRLQLVAPGDMRGRIMSIYQLLFAGTTPLGSLIVGGLAEHRGVRQATMLVALVCGLGVLLALAYLRRNAAQLLPDAPDEDAGSRAAATPVAPVSASLGK